MIRCFVAVELDDPLRRALADVQRRMRGRIEKALGPDSRVQWVRPESVHATLKFLGDVEESRIPDLEAALRRMAAAHPVGTVEVAGLGVFPDARNPRVLWVGLREGSALIARLAEAVDRAMSEVGFPPESRPFSPHLTLARIKEGGRAVGRALESQGLLTESPVLGRFSVGALALMQSALRPSGAVYTRLAEFALQAAG
ncbi:MAG: RNA 2',3'-cyclic phosphodiesterase [Nitrospira sp.]|nr:MAG: RNA 2',3'-cyclic phosphodiesterase [Nitrospira sp.]